VTNAELKNTIQREHADPLFVLLTLPSSSRFPAQNALFSRNTVYICIVMKARAAAPIKNRPGKKSIKKILCGSLIVT
jgi:hypothetical protein